MKIQTYHHYLQTFSLQVNHSLFFGKQTSILASEYETYYLLEKMRHIYVIKLYGMHCGSMCYYMRPALRYSQLLGTIWIQVRHFYQILSTTSTRVQSKISNRVAWLCY